MRTPLLLATILSLTCSAAVWGAPLPQNTPDKSLGVATCASSLCHGAVEPWKDSHVLQTEYFTWSRMDKHARAYSVLTNTRSQEIARKLGLKEPAHRSALCLDCHAHNVPQQRRGEHFVLSDGITCEGCHGPAEGWIKSHVEQGATHADNLARGMYPISDDVERARLCLSCHFGNRQKFVTHKMMAAGHPRFRIRGPVDEVGHEQAAEEHDFRDKEHPHPQRGRFELLVHAVEVMLEIRIVSVSSSGVHDFTSQRAPPGSGCSCRRAPSRSALRRS